MGEIEVALATVRGGTELVLEVPEGPYPIQPMPPMVLFLLSILMRAESDLTWFNDQMDWAKAQITELKKPTAPYLSVVN
jgi:hypothetical protein